MSDKKIRLYKSVPFEMNGELYLTKDFASEIKKNGVGIEVGMGLDLDDSKPYTIFTDQIRTIKKTLETYSINPETTRIHTPLGYKYQYWVDRIIPEEQLNKEFVSKYQPKKVTGRDGKNYYITNNYMFLKEVIGHALSLGFKDLVIHTPYGSSKADEKKEFKTLKKQLTDLASLAKQYNGNIDVECMPEEESSLGSKKEFRSYNSRYSELLTGTGARPLLDSTSTKGVQNLIELYKTIKGQELNVEAIHIQNLHQPISNKDLEKILKSGYEGVIVDESLYKKGYTKTHDEMLEVIKSKEKSKSSLLPKDEQIQILKGYKKLIDTYLEESG